MKELGLSEAEINAWLRENGRLAAEFTDESTGAKDAWAALGRTMADSFADIEGAIGKVGRVLGRTIEQMAQATTAAERWAVGLQAAYELVKDHNVTAGGFGGTGEGNYAQQGSAVGSVIGAIVGAYFAGPAGAQAGMAIGSAAGGILGSFIKKGAQEAIAHLELDSGQIVATLTTNEGSLGRVLKEVGGRINDAIKGILDQLGGTLLNLPQVSMKVRDGVISVWVGAINARVKEMDQAITFAVTEILKQGDIAGLSETIRTVLRNTKATDLDQLARDLDFGRWFENLGLDDAAVAVEQQIADFRTRFRQAVELGLDTVPIEQWFARQLEGVRNQILGVEESPEQRIRRQAQAFNQQLAIAHAEEESRKAELLVRKAQLEAEISLAEAEINVHRVSLEARADLISADIQATNSLISALDAVNSAIAAVDAAIAQIENIKPISEDEIDNAIHRNRNRRNRGGDQRQGVRDYIDEQQFQLSLRGLSDYKRSLAELARTYEEQKAAAKGNAQLIAELTGVYQQQQEALRQDAINGFNEQLRDFEGNSNPFEDLHKQADALRDAVADLGLDSNATAAALNRIAAAEGNRTRALANEMYLSLAEGLNKFVQDEDTKRALEQIRYTLEVENYRLQFELLKAQGVLTQEQIDLVQGLLDKIPDVLPATAPPGDGGGGYGYYGGGGGGGQSFEDMRNELIAQLNHFIHLGGDQLTNELNALNLQFQQMAERAVQLGVSLELVQAAHEAALHDFWERALQPIKDLQAQLNYSDLSPLAPEQQLANAQSDFDALIAAYNGGDLSALANIPNAAQTLLQLARDAYASGDGYQSIYQAVQAALAAISGGHLAAFPPPAAAPGANPVLGRSSSPGVLDVPLGGLVQFPTTPAAPGGADSRDDRVVREISLFRIQNHKDLVGIQERLDRQTEELAALNGLLERRTA